MRTHSGGHINTIWNAGGPFIGPDGKPHGRVTVQSGSGNVIHTTSAAPDLGPPYTGAMVRGLFTKYGFVSDADILNAVVVQPPTETATERVARIAVELTVGLRTWSELETSIRALPGAVQPDTPGVGSYKTRGLPLRWFQSAVNNQIEIEVPNIKTIDIDRSVSQDAATCNITLYNLFMPATGEPQPGYYTAERGDALDGTARWGFNKNAWHNTLVPNAILRTYQGLGGFNDDMTPKSIDQCRTEGSLVLTGIWFIDSVTVLTDGTLQIKARDPIKLLLEQQLYTPLVPHTRYPLKYYRWQYSNNPLHSAARTVDGLTYQPIFLGADGFRPGEGYWTTDGGTEVDAFGDAREHDRTGGTLPNPDSAATQVRGTPDGNGYYVLNGAGQIQCFGTAAFYGDPFSGGYIAANGFNGVTIDMAVTFTGHGYWVLDNFGHVFAYGDAPSYGDMPQIFTTGINEYNSIESHPSAYGYWVIDQAGNVLPSGACTNVGQRSILDWNPAMTPGGNDAVCIRATHTGNGYWILTDDGQVAAFGDAIYYGQNPDPQYYTDWRDKYWKLIPHFNGVTNDGYLLVRGDGAVLPFGSAVSYGSATPGGTATKRIDGNYRDYSDIVRDLVLWSGFLLYDPSMGQPRGSVPAPAPDPGPSQGGTYTEQNVRDLFLWYGYTTNEQIIAATSSPTQETVAQRIARIVFELNEGSRTWAELNTSISILAPADVLPAVYGNIESTGAASPEPMPDNIFDKRPVIEAIHQIKEVVGYLAWCDDEGAFRFESPNWWAPGNFDEYGNHLEWVPEVDERVQLTNYSVTVDDTPLRSMVIISSEDPDIGGTTTVTTRLVPRDAKKLRGMVKPAMWVNGWFQTRDEQRIMAELIALHIHFESRQGQATCAANPLIGIDDQVRIFERQSNEAFIHYVRGVHTSMDLDSGSYTMTLQTNWLGTSDGWGVSTSDLFLAEGGFKLSGTCVEWLQTQTKNPNRQFVGTPTVVLN